MVVAPSAQPDALADRSAELGPGMARAERRLLVTLSVRLEKVGEIDRLESAAEVESNGAIDLYFTGSKCQQHSLVRESDCDIRTEASQASAVQRLEQMYAP